MCKGPVVGISLVRLNPERSKFHVSGGRGTVGYRGLAGAHPCGSYGVWVFILRPQKP